MNADLEILYQDPTLLAVHKPAGMVVHASRLTGRETESCLTLLKRKLDRKVYPIHRLDRATSGVLLFGLSPEAVAETQALFAERKVRKKYLAVVRGYAPEEGVIDKPLRNKEDGPHKEAITRFRRLAQAELPFAVGKSPKFPTTRYSLVGVEPITGRMHQIRKHLYGKSYPLIGDTVYGDGSHNRFFREQFGLHRLCLASVEVSLPGRPPFRAIPAPELLALFERLGWTEAMKAFLA